MKSSVVLGGILDRDVTHATPLSRMAHTIQSPWCVSLVIGWNTYWFIAPVAKRYCDFPIILSCIIFGLYFQYVVDVFEYLIYFPNKFLTYSI